jgi:hypothetical protein
MDQVAEQLAAYQVVPFDAEGEAHQKCRIIAGLEGHLDDERVLGFFVELIGNPSEYDLARIEVLKIFELWRAPSAQAHERVARQVAKVVESEKDVLVQQWAAIAARNFSDTPEVLSSVATLLADRQADLSVRHNCLAAFRGKVLTAAVVEVLQRFVKDPELGTSVSRILERQQHQ